LGVFMIPHVDGYPAVLIHLRVVRHVASPTTTWPANVASSLIRRVYSPLSIAGMPPVIAGWLSWAMDPRAGNGARLIVTRRACRLPV
jgi:hypothetical protein